MKYLILLSKVLGLMVLIILASYITAFDSQSTEPMNTENNTQINQMEWVEKTIGSMSPEERIGQLFMVAAYSNKDYSHQQTISSLIKNNHIGGLIFFQGTAPKQAELTNYYQGISKTPLLIAIDGEWGLSMRLKDTPRYPKQLTLGAIQDNSLINKMGADIARQCKRMGIHINLAPVVDVNNNPNNPVINDRSFGEDKYNVANKGIAYMQGMEQNGIIACAKHFPGHGDTDSDSHHTLPVIKHDINRLRDIEFYPFRELAKYNIGGMMVAHLDIPALDATPVKPGSPHSMPTTLSKKVVTDLLKKEMGYKGLIFTDALNMKGVSNYFEPGIVDVKALIAGNDVLLFPENVGRAVSEIKKAMAAGEITQEEIDTRVRKILNAKYKVGLHQRSSIIMAGLQESLNTTPTELLIRHLYENAITIAADNSQQIPFKELEKKSFASLAIGAAKFTEFQATLGKYAPVEHHTIKYTDVQNAYDQKFAALKDKSHVIISLHGMNKYASKNWGLNEKALKLIKQLEQVTNVSLVVLGSPYSLKHFSKSNTVVVAYEENDITQSVSAQVLFGGIPAKGKLPVTASPSFRYGQGYTSAAAIRFKYTIPEDAGINAEDLRYIDHLAKEAITSKATPGCQVFIAKGGKVIFEKSYGHHTYSRRRKVKNSDLYDLASVTKVAASMLGVMELYENQEMRLTDKFGTLLPELQGTSKSNLLVKDVLTHSSGLKAWIPFYEATMPSSVYNRTYKKECTDIHCVPIAKNMYMDKNYEYKIWQTINQSPVTGKGKYRYSDVGFYLFKKLIEKKAYTSMDKYLANRFYKPLGLHTLTYKPTDQFSTYSITPTENDTKWRKQIVHGYVHDMGAAMMGGVGGHAGLFSNANDLGVIMQMLLDGHYGGRYYFNPETIQTFTAYQKKGSRRGLGFDKPEPNDSRKNPAGDAASSKTFGHTGFTGTCAWADPEHDLIFIFLSNRTYPKMNNYKLIKLNTRTKIHDAIYSAIYKAKSRANRSRYNGG